MKLFFDAIGRRTTAAEGSFWRQAGIMVANSLAKNL